MYIKNRRNNAKCKASDSYQTSCLNESLVLRKPPTFHILTVGGQAKMTINSII